MFLRALLAFLLMPFMVAFVAPALIASGDVGLSLASVPGLAVGASGAIVLVMCVRQFYVEGRGTLAPWAPPRRLIRGGLYRFSRNPMYIGVSLILAGWALAFFSRPLAFYALAVSIGFHMRVLWGEEPALARTFGPEWDAYRCTVPRWVGRR